MKRLFGTLCVGIAIPCLLAGCKSKADSAAVDNMTNNTSVIRETMADEITAAQSEESPSASESAGGTAASDNTDDTKDTAITTEAATTEAGSSSAKVSANTPPQIETYKENNVTIHYPVVTHLNDDDKQRAVNDLIKSNAISVLSSNGINQQLDTVSVNCKVISMDRSRFTVIYTGSYQTQEMTEEHQLFYTNTVDLDQVCSLGFHDYADPYTMAGYLLSDDCVFYQTSPQKAEQLNQVKKENDIWHYTELFKEADFTSNPSFPSTFSYENQGVLYFSIPVAHELGDYALITYPLEDGK